MLSISLRRSAVLDQRTRSRQAPAIRVRVGAGSATGDACVDDCVNGGGGTIEECKKLCGAATVVTDPATGQVKVVKVTADQPPATDLKPSIWWLAAPPAAGYLLFGLLGGLYGAGSSALAYLLHGRGGFAS